MHDIAAVAKTGSLHYSLTNYILIRWASLDLCLSLVLDSTRIFDALVTRWHRSSRHSTVAAALPSSWHASCSGLWIPFFASSRLSKTNILLKLSIHHISVCLGIVKCEYIIVLNYSGWSKLPNFYKKLGLPIGHNLGGDIKQVCRCLAENYTVKLLRSLF